ncbi:DUF5131 family protein [Sulfitobacter pseudonitzschiae]|uniref:DUF5131 family protein n=1 Tax=Pseudosulfitobacter pseudonitzschiae TaxID=1402135 RepID=A0A9Q2P4N7_9RHOB|nr:DUF5131 family protein [Pseudosulfitobacter pseudonitzschiae]MBM2293776.1 DUF5131 family protein [Pseudosulfitobacter pseudonitzschiae]MBM2298694.1 DUF5131 family protein [Pseudosulfitobacter pseudonitzschiae]MBM2303608.1 DUF5131 family protein [Pseudosulfitobacter pseudonitzschiae]MBM2313391.1 DUF5131 family protein [Pseudosulfitobacter pseudonitzschiae]MBM2318304.1 DUF5131 family protein [Pseudosulfitobacter pseudonitzschiae]
MTITETKIEWTDFTVNFWEGCQKVGPGCDHCYAEARDVRFTGGTHWGPGAPRRKVIGGIAKLRKINRGAEAFHAAHGRWPRVFCSSLSDVFDNAVDEQWRVQAFNEIELASDCRFQLLTKRVGNVEKMVRDIWDHGRWPQHVGLMITVVNQAEADRDIPKLLDLKTRLGIPWVGLSMEPLLGPVRLDSLPIKGMNHDVLTGQVWQCGGEDNLGVRTDGAIVDWVIAGGESGRNARPMHPDWARRLRDQCEAAGTPFFMKQMGGTRKPFPEIPDDLNVRRFPNG